MPNIYVDMELGRVRAQLDSFLGQPRPHLLRALCTRPRRESRRSSHDGTEQDLAFFFFFGPNSGQPVLVCWVPLAIQVPMPSAGEPRRWETQVGVLRQGPSAERGGQPSGNRPPASSPPCLRAYLLQFLRGVTQGRGRPRGNTSLRPYYHHDRSTLPGAPRDFFFIFKKKDHTIS